MEKEHTGIDNLDLWGLHFEFRDTNSERHLERGIPSRWVISVEGQELGGTRSSATPSSIKFIKETLRHTGVLILNKASLVWSEGSTLPILMYDSDRTKEFTFDSMEELATYIDDNYLSFESLSSYRGIREDF